MKLSNVRGMCVLSWRLDTSLGPWSLGKCTKSLMWSLGSAEVVCGLDYQLEKSDQVVTEIYVGFEFEVMTSESLHCWQGDRWAKMRKHTSMGLMQMTFKLTQQPNRCGQSQSSEAWHWPSFHCEWGYISVTVHCSSLDFWSSWHFEQSRASFSFSQGNI